MTVNLKTQKNRDASTGSLSAAPFATFAFGRLDTETRSNEERDVTRDTLEHCGYSMEQALTGYTE